MKRSQFDPRRFEEKARTRKFSLYLQVLRVALSRWYALTRDRSGLDFLEASDYSSLFAYADSLVDSKYPTAALHFAANQLASLVRKYPWDCSLIGTRPRDTAVASFYAAEHRCLRMNQWFRARRRTFRNDGEDFQRMRAWIRYVISDAPDLKRVYELADFTGGASLGVHGNATNLMRKLCAESWTCTPSALPYFSAALNHNFHYATRVAPSNGLVQSLRIASNDTLRHCTTVGANKIAFVPKTAKTFRSIAVEPLGNGFLQKGVDLLMRTRLKRIGIDLSDQNRNREMARKGSLLDSEDGFVTIDLSSASDSISIELCREVLPPDWFNFLNSIRSPSFQIDGTVKTYQKFCSMGNGFCFPLETLIFASVCHAVRCGKPGVDFMVYGDDIIVRKKFFPSVISLLSRCGFSVNRRKTFSEGPFRESCGADWYAGEDVRPFTLDFALDSLSAYFKFINLARRNSRSSEFLRECILVVLNSIPERFRFIRPYKGAPDTGIDPFDLQFVPTQVRWSFDKNLQCLRWYELSFSSIEDRMKPPSWVVMAAALRGSPSTQMFTVRRKTRVRVRLVARSGDLAVI